MARRKIVEIDRDKCDGCGLCTTACAEGALALDAQNKAVLVREIFCDGLGACLDVCPTGALKVVEREGDEYDARAAFDHVLETRGAAAASRVHGADAEKAQAAHRGCPVAWPGISPASRRPVDAPARRPDRGSVSGPSSSISSPPWLPISRAATSLSPPTARPSPSADSTTSSSKARSSSSPAPSSTTPGATWRSWPSSSSGTTSNRSPWPS